MSPLLFVAAVGIVVLLGLAVVVGVLDGGSRRAAWARIAERRRSLAALERSLAEHRQELADWEDALVEETERRRLDM